MAKKQRSTSPSIRLRTFSVAPSIHTSLATKRSTKEARMQRGTSFVMVLRGTCSGMIAAVTPRIKRTLKMFDPTTLPMAKSGLPLRAESTLTVSSGAEVPKATIVSPITRFEMRNRLATAAAPSVRALAPTRISTSPMTTKTRDIHTLFIVFPSFLLHCFRADRWRPEGRRARRGSFLISL